MEGEKKQPDMKKLINLIIAQNIKELLEDQGETEVGEDEKEPAKPEWKALLDKRGKK